ncbi:DNA replication and repair protein RecF [Candidatus Woesebacteria bacterium]|nr:DNA replication and repair protein RecF [Candidatus Woesebacteria bacterium]
MTIRLTHIYLTNFRNFAHSDFPIGPDLTLIIGQNARGKTSLLEGIYCTVYGTGFRESREVELVRWEADANLIEGTFSDGDHDNLFQLKLQQTSETKVQKSFYVNKTKKTSTQYRTLQTHAVLFAPEQIQIITGSPSRRRRYFDEVLSAIDLDYKKKLHNYERALRRRNKILEVFEDEIQLLSEIAYWNAYLIEQASYITHARQQYIAFLNSHPEVNGKEFTITYHKDEFSQSRLIEAQTREYRFRRTLIGPQKDDFEVFLHEPKVKEVSLYGSRSEQRMAIFWLKLNELLYFEQASHAKPILLLDDIFSELDDRNRELVMKVIREYQTIATTTEEEIKDLSQMPEEVIRL